MKKVILSLGIMTMLGVFILPGKNASAQTQFGVKVGPSFSNMTVKDNDGKEEGKMKTNFEGGVYANLGIAPEVYIQPSLLYEGKGAKAKGDFPGEISLSYLTLPINFLYKPEMMNGSAWFIGFGPYVGYALSGKIQLDGTSGSLDPFKNMFGDGEDKSMMERFDAGFNVQLGYELMNGFNLGVNANLGLVNIGNKDIMDDKTKITNTNFGVTVGYTLGR